jgi:hypothetical protein
MNVNHGKPVQTGQSRAKPCPGVLVRWGQPALVLLFVVGIGAGLVFSVIRSREAAIASQANSPLNILSVALHNYHDTYGSFPPAYLADEQGRPMHSWRVLILPYLEQRAIYQQYRFDEPWDGPYNSQLADRMPSTFHIPSEPPSTSRTNIVAIVGEPTAFPGARATRFRDFRDGTGNTILLTEIADSDIPWLEPRDLCFQKMSFTVNDRTRPSISCSRRRGPYVVLADSISAYTVRDVHPEALRAMATIDGAEEVAVADIDHGWLTSFSAPPVTDEALLQFRHWPRVHGVRLIRTRISDAGLDALTAANSLRDLNLSETPVTDQGLRRIAGLTGLCYLNLSDTLIGDEGLKIMVELTSLQSLNLAGTRVTDEGLKHLTSLTHLYSLNLSRTQITDDGLAALAALPKLTWLTVYETAVSEQGEAAVLTARPGLRIRRIRN